MTKLIQSCGLHVFKVNTPTGDWHPDVHTYSSLVDHLLAIRAGHSDLPGLSVDTQHHLYLLCGIPVKDLDNGTLAQCANRFSKRFLQSLGAVATRPIASWQTLTKDDLKALLGVLGYPYLATASKQQLLGLVPAAQRLAVYQGHLIPQILQPYSGITLP